MLTQSQELEDFICGFVPIPCVSFQIQDHHLVRREYLLPVLNIWEIHPGSKIHLRSEYQRLDSIEDTFDTCNVHVQWNLGIRDTQGTVKNCPEF